MRDPQIIRDALGNANVKAFSRVVRQGETDQTDLAYRRISGGGYFDSFAAHPYAGMSAPPGKAAGAYQDLPHTWANLAKLYPQDMADFSPAAQDFGCVADIADHGVLGDVLAGRIELAIDKLRHEWTSLPGASENNPRWTMADALALYASYGGTTSDYVAPSAPIADQPTIAKPKQGTPMPSTIDTVAGIAGMFNPMAGGIIGLAGKLFEAYEPALQDKVAKEINRHTDDPSVGAQIAANLGQMAVTQAQALTGKTDAFDAVAAARADPATLAQLQANTDAELDRLVRVADKSAGYDQALWAAQNAGKQVVSSIAIEEHKAGLWDMTKSIVISLLIMLWGIAWGLLFAIIYLAISGKADANPAMLTALVGLAGPIWAGAIVASVVAIVSYRFDGSKDASVQTKMLMAKLDK